MFMLCMYNVCNDNRRIGRKWLKIHRFRLNYDFILKIEFVEYSRIVGTEAIRFESALCELYVFVLAKFYIKLLQLKDTKRTISEMKTFLILIFTFCNLQHKITKTIFKHNITSMQRAIMIYSTYEIY